MSNDWLDSEVETVVDGSDSWLCAIAPFANSSHGLTHLLNNGTAEHGTSQKTQTEQETSNKVCEHTPSHWTPKDPKFGQFAKMTLIEVARFQLKKSMWISGTVCSKLSVLFHCCT